MAAMGMAAAVAAGGAIGIIAYQTSCGCYPGSRPVAVPVKKRASTSSVSGECMCLLPGNLSRSKLHLTLVGDMLLYGSGRGQAEGSIFLRGAELCKDVKVLHVIKDGERAISIDLNDENADFWLQGLSSAVRAETLPKLFSVHTREAYKKKEEATNAHANVSKLLSLKRRELTEVEEKAQTYQMMADQHQQKVLELEARISSFEVLASQKDQENERLRLEVEANENKKIETARFPDRLEDLEVSGSSGSSGFCPQRGGGHRQRDSNLKNQKMEEVQKRLLAMQKLLESEGMKHISHTTPAATRKGRHSVPASFQSQAGDRL